MDENMTIRRGRYTDEDAIAAILADDKYVRKDGTEILTGDWDAGDGRKILVDEIRARDGDGLKLYDDGGNGIFVEDGGQVGIGTTTPSEKLDIYQGNIDIDDTTNANKNGIIYKDGTPYLHNFNYGDNGAVTTAGHNLFIGSDAGNLTMGATAANAWESSYNTAIGSIAFIHNTTGRSNLAMGHATLHENTTGYFNLAMGANALHKNTTGYRNTAVGYIALTANTTGIYNTAIGDSALVSNTTGYANTAIGWLASMFNTTGYRNTAVGRSAGRYTAVGATPNQTSEESVYLGYETRALADGDTNEVVIGATAVGIGSNTVVLGNDSITTTALKGNVGVATTTPTAKLDINSDIIRLRTSKTPASAGAAGNQGDICWDADYIYVCTATNTWKRTAISTW